MSSDIEYCGFTLQQSCKEPNNLLLTAADDVSSYSETEAPKGKPMDRPPEFHVLVEIDVLQPPQGKHRESPPKGSA